MTVDSFFNEAQHEVNVRTIEAGTYAPVRVKVQAALADAIRLLGEAADYLYRPMALQNRIGSIALGLNVLRASRWMKTLAIKAPFRDFQQRGLEVLCVP